MRAPNIEKLASIDGTIHCLSCSKWLKEVGICTDCIRIRCSSSSTFLLSPTLAGRLDDAFEYDWIKWAILDGVLQKRGVNISFLWPYINVRLRIAFRAFACIGRGSAKVSAGLIYCPVSNWQKVISVGIIPLCHQVCLTERMGWYLWMVRQET